MNVVVFPLLLLCEIVHVSRTFKGERLKAVTRFPGLQQYYEMIKTQGRTRQLEIDGDTRERICGQIFMSAFFAMNDERSFITTSKRDRKLLKKKYRATYKEHYKRSSEAAASSEPSCFGKGSSNTRSEYTYLNPDRVRAVMVEGDFLNAEEYYQESVFVCFSAHRQWKSVRKYFVSAVDYNVNRAINSSGRNEYVAGRFVLKEAEVEVNAAGREKSLFVYALAEESGQTFRKGEEAVEAFYLGKKRGRESIGKYEDDPVCALSADEKLRLCSIAMSSPDVEQRGYEFYPQTVFLEADCKPRQVWFRTPKGLQTALDREYKEWMIGCQVKNDENLYEPFYVSRGYAANCAFVYKPDVSGFLYVLFFQDNVSVLRD